MILSVAPGHGTCMSTTSTRNSTSESSPSTVSLESRAHPPNEKCGSCKCVVNHESKVVFFGGGDKGELLAAGGRKACGSIDGTRTGHR